MIWDPSGNLLNVTANTPEGVLKVAEVAQAYIRSRVVMKLGLFALSALFLIVAALLVVFAPPGRETAATVISTSLLVVAIGSAGFTAFRFKIPFVSAEAQTFTDQSQHGDKRDFSGRNTNAHGGPHAAA
ncbi:hypothetical protein [Beijerinckia sp. L45]|uniref:hypothetical protein n=1 Tax=Beijerinckia sp. L45 TaxID=1641855 RepID=UPI00131B466A|nr:hypothetical protein [Beijerinckia sp. L45]